MAFFSLFPMLLFQGRFSLQGLPAIPEHVTAPPCPVWALDITPLLATSECLLERIAPDPVCMKFPPAGHNP